MVSFYFTVMKVVIVSSSRRLWTKFCSILETLAFSLAIGIRYMEIPVISRFYLTGKARYFADGMISAMILCSNLFDLSGALLTTAACQLDIVSPLSLYFNYNLIFQQGQLWRLLTSYLFYGTFSVDFIFHLFFLVSPCRRRGEIAIKEGLLLLLFKKKINLTMRFDSNRFDIVVC